MLAAIIDLSCLLMKPRLLQVFEPKNARAVKRFGSLHWNLYWHGSSNPMPVSHLPIMVHATHGVPELNASLSHQQPTSKTRTSKQTSNQASDAPVKARPSRPFPSLPFLPLTTTTITTTTRRPVSVSQLKMDNFRS
ncbi:uncharacterized protein NECHADRAFT_80511 [Fusarium vanettenii 77-13-4]|uniref:Uncharacterized protein n=1 Tax=Fusarium vanettenii (strain ATCC MYA-4622 / CBS 123669 / FGSC 9596 / NRRL 45880 / 77-13-4) TaxID=660122 RepID=C7YRU3_FUSV7|nr:uncharacterized protein NECHADRAFT_80511 [Fusarium vanettenii 77-13-4]EEU45522.1 predicted protein [Fusarium vanettenii 77-13-4]